MADPPGSPRPYGEHIDGIVVTHESCRQRATTRKQEEDATWVFGNPNDEEKQLIFDCCNPLLEPRFLNFSEQHKYNEVLKCQVAFTKSALHGHMYKAIAAHRNPQGQFLILGDSMVPSLRKTTQARHATEQELAARADARRAKTANLERWRAVANKKFRLAMAENPRVSII